MICLTDACAIFADSMDAPSSVKGRECSVILKRFDTSVVFEKILQVSLFYERDLYWDRMPTRLTKLFMIQRLARELSVYVRAVEEVARETERLRIRVILLQGKLSMFELNLKTLPAAYKSIPDLTTKSRELITMLKTAKNLDHSAYEENKRVSADVEVMFKSRL
jgi:hypothetical protein